jgi:hypothetical protein
MPTGVAANGTIAFTVDQPLTGANPLATSGSPGSAPVITAADDRIVPN